ncbi:MAG: hypothetical protein HY953_05115 [Candidatus Rokubacteria bacterium]|nr:hypothetical protein [Candidatus Rokubacteria bacterium]
MKLREHVVLGGGAAAALAPALGAENSLIFFASSVLIDADHYWDYVHRNGFTGWSWPKTFAFHAALFPKIHAPDFLALSVFHTVEWFLAVWLLGAVLGSSAVFVVFLGMAYHLVLDLVFLVWRRATFKRALSLIEYHLRRRHLVRRGLDPDRVYREALAEIGVRPAPLPAAVRADAAS